MSGLTTTVVRAYIRVSTEEQALSGFSLQAQADCLQSVAQSRGWRIARVYQDDGYSAKDMNRPGLRQLLQDAQPGDILLVYKLDRLTRSVRDLEDLLRHFDQRGLMFQSATEQFETTTASGRLFLRIVTEIAQWERETIAERSAMGKRKKVELGEWAGGPVPYGYKAVPSDKVKAGKRLLKLVPDPPKARVVSAIFERYISGYGMRAICRWLNDELGVRTSSGARWRVSSLSRLLTNPIYCGDVTHGRRLKSETIRVPGSHQPLISPDLFERVQQLFAVRKGMPPRQATGAYPLAGVARCGVCGGGIDANFHRKKRAYVYRCRNYANGLGCGDGRRKPLSAGAGRQYEERLVQLLHSLPSPQDLPHFFQACTDATRGEADREAELDRLNADLAEAQACIRRWDRAYERGGLEWAEYLARIEPHKERISVLHRQICRLKDKPVPLPRAVLASSQPLDFRLAWRHLTPPERKLLLLRFRNAFGVQIALYPGRRVELVPQP